MKRMPTLFKQQTKQIGEGVNINKIERKVQRG